MKGFCADHRHPERIAPITYHEASSWYRMNPNPRCSICIDFFYLHFVTNRYIQGQMQVNISYMEHLGTIGQILGSLTCPILTYAPLGEGETSTYLQTHQFWLFQPFFWGGRGLSNPDPSRPKKQCDTSSQKVVFLNLAFAFSNIHICKSMIAGVTTERDRYRQHGTPIK